MCIELLPYFLVITTPAVGSCGWEDVWTGGGGVSKSVRSRGFVTRLGRVYLSVLSMPPSAVELSMRPNLRCRHLKNSRFYFIYFIYYSGLYILVELHNIQTQTVEFSSIYVHTYGNCTILWGVGWALPPGHGTYSTLVTCV